ncbi:hypothetical protein [Paramicrobacterium fandaimingii]|uniref:hypothetical protein n=1 Tax=Paramicrobacterium fandaimingii TaxID=2708079 RepID=UPI001423D6F0|nr:hypothetical protein [Microbacterium fandaimingii]
MTQAVSPRDRYRQWPSLALGILFGLFYAYDLWEAVGNVLTLAGVASQLGITLSAAAWVVLIVSILMPIGIFITALLLGRSHRYSVQAVFYVCGLAVSAATYLSLVSAISFA